MIDWTGVKSILDTASKEAREFETIDESMNYYNSKVVEALQLMISTAMVNGGNCPPNGPLAGAIIT